MKVILHIVHKQALPKENQNEYTEDTPSTEGFIHCSTLEQVAEVANYVFKGSDDLFLMVIDEEKVVSKIKYEDAGNGKYYPHIYGSLNIDAVIDIIPYNADESGNFLEPVLQKSI